MSDLAVRLSQKLAADLEVRDWRVVQAAIARRVPGLIRIDAQPHELSADEYESLREAVDDELSSQR